MLRALLLELLAVSSRQSAENKHTTPPVKPRNTPSSHTHRPLQQHNVPPLCETMGMGCTKFSELKTHTFRKWPHRNAQPPRRREREDRGTRYTMLFPCFFFTRGAFFFYTISMNGCDLFFSFPLSRFEPRSHTARLVARTLFTCSVAVSH